MFSSQRMRVLLLCAMVLCVAAETEAQSRPGSTSGIADFLEKYLAGPL